MILYCRHYLCVPLFSSYIAITIIINACSILFSHNYSLQRISLSHDFSVHAQLHLRLTELLLTVVCFALPLCSPTHSVWSTFWSSRFLFSPSRELSQPLVYAHSYIYLSLFYLMYLVVIDLLGSCSMYLLVCILNALSLVVFWLSISFTLMIFVIIAFAYYFREKWY